MKVAKLLSILFVVTFFTSCVSVRVSTDYDRQANFNQYKSFAFFKPGIDKAEISDLDKKRILRAIESEMLSKGFIKSENPDILVSIFTQERERVDMYNNYGWSWGPGWGGGWNPWWGMGYNNVYTRTEGSLYIDLIDAKEKELVWQGKGTGYLTKDTEKKQERINEFVKEILGKFPPGIGQ
ncbi:DUF4136 domain-containing protein [Abyssalbus ytuae]|uniref:DUF4136 domain-containing protein n=1 Tax=Abyssalbus ytuae TaxID=2926907 RepID=A0A9E6ZXA8_9FLAO|nr:DUF4136 domain-containing protein [Abyssalbus ytuae]UOB18556.1 DUF4136 domain-containing protein [Abyssalbus ytuae]